MCSINSCEIIIVDGQYDSWINGWVSEEQSEKVLGLMGKRCMQVELMQGHCAMPENATDVGSGCWAGAQESLHHSKALSIRPRLCGLHCVSGVVPEGWRGCPPSQAKQIYLDLFHTLDLCDCFIWRTSSWFEKDWMLCKAWPFLEEAPVLGIQHGQKPGWGVERI